MSGGGTIGGSTSRAGTLGGLDPRARRDAQSFGKPAVTVSSPLGLDRNGKVTLNNYAFPLDVEGGTLVYRGLVPTQVKTADYMARYNDLVLCNPTGAGFSVFLPDPTERDSAWIVVKNNSSSANTITINAGSSTVDGSATLASTAAWASFILFPTPQGWVVI